MSKKELTEAAKRQRASGKELALWTFAVVALVGFLLLLASLTTLLVTGSFITGIKRMAFFGIYAMVLASPTLLAALLQYLLRPGWVTMAARWAGYICLLPASVGMALAAIILCMAS